MFFHHHKSETYIAKEYLFQLFTCLLFHFFVQIIDSQTAENIIILILMIEQKILGDL